MILLLFLLGVDRSGRINSIIEFRMMVNSYIKTQDKNIEKEIDRMYQNIKPDGMHYYIRYLLRKDDDERIKKEITYWIEKISPVEKTINVYGEKWVRDLNGKIFDAIHLTRSRPYYYYLLSLYIPLLEKYIERSKDVATKKRLLMYRREIVYDLGRNVPIDTLFKYRKPYYPVISQMKDKFQFIKKKEEEMEKSLKWRKFIEDGDYKEAMKVAENPYQKSITLLFLDKNEEAESELKKAILTDSVFLLPIYILLKTDQKDVKPVLLDFLKLKDSKPVNEPGITIYNIFKKKMIIMPDDSLLLPYSLYYDAIKDRKIRKRILESYPFTSPAFMLRVLEK